MRGEKTESDIRVSRIILQIIKNRGLNPNAVARKAGLDNANFYRLLRNERKWQFAHLEKVCEALSITFKDLFGGPLTIPVVATISALRPFSYPHIISPTVLGNVEYHGTTQEVKMELYAIEIEDRSFMPAFGAGTRFLVAKNSAHQIKDETLVVCPDDQGGAQICRIHFTSKESITLRSLNPTVSDRILPISHLKLCDQVVVIYPV